MNQQLFLIIFILFTSFTLYADNTALVPQDIQQSEKTNLNKLSYQDFLRLYQENIDSQDYKKALFFARMAFSNATNIEERSYSMLYISDVYLALGDYKKAKMIYRQIIQNYYKQEKLIKEIKSRLLKL